MQGGRIFCRLEAPDLLLTQAASALEHLQDLRVQGFAPQRIVEEVLLERLDLGRHLRAHLPLLSRKLQEELLLEHGHALEEIEFQRERARMACADFSEHCAPELRDLLQEGRQSLRNHAEEVRVELGHFLQRAAQDVDELVPEQVEDVGDALLLLPGAARVRLSLLQTHGHLVNLEGLAQHQLNVAGEGLVDQCCLRLRCASALHFFTQRVNFSFPSLKKTAQSLVNDCLDFITETLLGEEDRNGLLQRVPVSVLERLCERLLHFLV